MTIKHPAKYSGVLLPHLKELLKGKTIVLDCFGGTGRLKEICSTATILEIEPEWAELSGALVGDATNMDKDWTGKFQAVCTSPCYGNRMADSFNAKDTSKRNTYHHVLGRKPTLGSSAVMQWGNKYKGFHIKAWEEVFRVLEYGGIFILNISDHIRKGEVVKVSEWHKDTILKLGFALVEHRKIKTPRNKYGANRQRVEFESIYVFEKLQNCNKDNQKVKR